MKLELRNVTKSFGDLVANESIDLTLESGKIHCLLGENGAGKSTLMNILCGLYKPDVGGIYLDGAQLFFSNPKDAIAAGIGMVHQHFMLIQNFTVAENIALGEESTKFGNILDLEETRKKINKISKKFGFDIDPDIYVNKLSVGLQQRVEIVKALVRDVKVLILDEPTAVLTPQETDQLMNIMIELKKSGTAIVFISHKLREVKKVSDAITVLRRGKIVGRASAQASSADLAALMVGRNVSLQVDKTVAKVGQKVFRVSGLVVKNSQNKTVLSDISFDIAEGEILVFAGVEGNGQKELAETMIGIRKATAGSIVLNNVEMVDKSVYKRLESGLGFVPEDRNSSGLVGDFSIADNLILDLYDQVPFSNKRVFNRKAIAQFAEKKIVEFDIRTKSVDSLVKNLSGGNQQKVVLARALSRSLQLFIASQPTRGVDVGSIEFIHKRIVAQRDLGTPILIISTELDEVLALADRIAVLYKGKIVGIVPGGTDKNVIGLMMSGVAANLGEDSCSVSEKFGIING